jgi:hypothetical protein
MNKLHMEITVTLSTIARLLRALLQVARRGAVQVAFTLAEHPNKAARFLDLQKTMSAPTTKASSPAGPWLMTIACPDVRARAAILMKRK